MDASATRPASVLFEGPPSLDQNAVAAYHEYTEAHGTVDFNAGREEFMALLDLAARGQVVLVPVMVGAAPPSGIKVDVLDPVARRYHRGNDACSPDPSGRVPVLVYWIVASTVCTPPQGDETVDARVTRMENEVLDAMSLPRGTPFVDFVNVFYEGRHAAIQLDDKLTAGPVVHMVHTVSRGRCGTLDPVPMPAFVISGRDRQCVRETRFAGLDAATPKGKGSAPPVGSISVRGRDQMTRAAAVDADAVHECLLGLVDLKPYTAVVFVSSAAGVMPQGALPLLPGVRPQEELCDSVVRVVHDHPGLRTQVLVLDTAPAALDMPHIPAPSAICLKDGRRFVFGDVAFLLRELAGEEEPLFRARTTRPAHLPKDVAARVAWAINTAASDTADVVAKGHTERVWAAIHAARGAPGHPPPFDVATFKGVILSRSPEELAKDGRWSVDRLEEEAKDGGGAGPDLTPTAMPPPKAAEASMDAEADAEADADADAKTEAMTKPSPQYMRTWLAQHAVLGDRVPKDFILKAKSALGFMVSRGLCRNPFRYMGFTEARASPATAVQILTLLSMDDWDLSMFFQLFGNLDPVETSTRLHPVITGTPEREPMTPGDPRTILDVMYDEVEPLRGAGGPGPALGGVLRRCPRDLESTIAPAPAPAFGGAATLARTRAKADANWVGFVPRNLASGPGDDGFVALASKWFPFVATVTMGMGSSKVPTTLALPPCMFGSHQISIAAGRVPVDGPAMSMYFAITRDSISVAQAGLCARQSLADLVCCTRGPSGPTDADLLMILTPPQVLLCVTPTMNWVEGFKAHLTETNGAAHGATVHYTDPKPKPPAS
jgi:hypothetical protein